MSTSKRRPDIADAIALVVAVVIGVITYNAAYSSKLKAQSQSILSNDTSCHLTLVGDLGYGFNLKPGEKKPIPQLPNENISIRTNCDNVQIQTAP